MRPPLRPGHVVLGLLLALSGFSYSGVEMRMGFAPKINADDFRTFWTTGSGWGRFAQKSAGEKSAVYALDVESGSQALSSFTVTLPPSLRGKEAKSALRFDPRGKPGHFRIPGSACPLRRAARISPRSSAKRTGSPINCPSGRRRTVSS